MNRLWEWMSEPLRIDECESRLPAGALGAVAAPVSFGLVAAGHELVTGTTGLSPLTILIAYPMSLALHSVVFTLLIGIPYVMLYDRFLAGPRWWFILGATVAATAVGGGFYGWPGLFALTSLANATVFALVVRPRQ